MNGHDWQDLYDRAKVIESPSDEHLESLKNELNKKGMAEAKVYPKGVVAFKPHERAPKFVIASVVISPQILALWCAGEGKELMSDYKGTEQIKLQITEYEGKYSVSVDSYKKPE